MNILGTQYDADTKSFEIYVAGCTRHCKGCHNPESWEFEAGKGLSVNKLVAKIKEFDGIIDNIKVMGGEPLDQDKPDFYLLTCGLFRLKKKLWLFTSYELKEVPEYLLGAFHYIKVGKYDCTKLTDNNVWHGVKLASSNQKIYLREDLL